MSYPSQILALDLAAKTGWALGYTKDAIPQSGTIRFAKEGASMAAVFSACRLQLRDFLSMNPEIGLVVFESPMLPMHMLGRTTKGTLRSLIGMAAVVEEMLYTIGKYDVREARVSDVRSHFIGSNRHKRAVAKVMTIEACRRLGWAPGDDNEADALALWHYQAAILQPELAVQTSPLFRRGR
jgi:hypothetical protein